MNARLFVIIAFSVLSIYRVLAQETSGSIESTATTASVAISPTETSAPTEPMATPTPASTPAPTAPIAASSKKINPASPIDLQMLASASSTTLENGVRTFDYELGTGEQLTTSAKAKYFYRLFLTDGTIVENRYDIIIPTPFESALTTEAIVPGLPEGMDGMKIGGIRYIELPRNLGYAERGGRGIPPNAIILFEIYLVAIQNGDGPWIDVYSQKQ